MIKEIGEIGYATLLMRLKFGDIIENGHASENNPRRFGIVVKPRAYSIQLTDTVDFWDLVFDSNSKIKIHGNVLNDNYENIIKSLK